MTLFHTTKKRNVLIYLKFENKDFYFTNLILLTEYLKSIVEVYRLDSNRLCIVGLGRYLVNPSSLRIKKG